MNSKPEMLEWKKLKKGGWLVVIKQNDEIHVFIIYYSTRKGKKYDVYELNKTNKNLDYILSFGDSTRGHFHDKLGGYDELDHNDPKRRELYFKRHKSHNNDIYSAKYWAHVILWNGE